MNQLCPVIRQQPAAFSGRLAPLTSPMSSQSSRFCARPGYTAVPRAVADESDTEWGTTTKEFDFMYMSPEQVLAAEMKSEAARQEGLAEYEALKEMLLRRTWRFGTFFAGYLLLAVSGECAFAELLGAAASYGYLTWLIRDVDAVDEDSEIPLKAAEQVQPALARNVAKIFAAYRQAFKPRLLVPIGLVAGSAAWNAYFPDYAFGIVEQGCLVGGFLSFKIALIGKVYDDLKPKVLTAEDLMREKRPDLVDVGEDVKLNEVIKRPSEFRKEKGQQEENSDSNGAENQEQQ